MSGTEPLSDPVAHDVLAAPAPDAPALTVEVMGEVIVARVRGRPTAALIARCQHLVLEQVRATGIANVLYDALAMDAPTVDVPAAQRALDVTLRVPLRRAIVVADTRLADLARFAFGEGEFRIFLRDFDGAMTWLNGGP